jgi:ankyrin repeat protein
MRIRQNPYSPFFSTYKFIIFVLCNYGYSTALHEYENTKTSSEYCIIIPDSPQSKISSFYKNLTPLLNTKSLLKITANPTNINTELSAFVTKSSCSGMIVIGCARGAQTTLPLLTNQSLPIKAVILESPIDPTLNLLSHHLKKYADSPQKPLDFIKDALNESTIHPTILNITKSRCQKNIPVLIVHCIQNTKSSVNDARLLYITLVMSGYTNVYLLELDHYGDYTQSTYGQNGEIYTNTAHAFYQKHNITYDTIRAFKGKELLKTCQPYIEDTAHLIIKSNILANPSQKMAPWNSKITALFALSSLFPFWKALRKKSFFHCNKQYAPLPLNSSSTDEQSDDTALMHKDKPTLPSSQQAPEQNLKEALITMHTHEDSGVRKNNYKQAIALIRKGALVNQTDAEGTTPLHWVASIYPELSNHQNNTQIDTNNNIALAKELIFFMANVNASDNNGITPLHYAITANNTNLVKLFLDYGADINAVTNYNQTPLATALMNNMLDTAYFLMQNGAQVMDEHKPILSSSILQMKKMGVITHPLSIPVIFNDLQHLQNHTKIPATEEGIDEMDPLNWAMALGHKDCIPLLIKRKPLPIRSNFERRAQENLVRVKLAQESLRNLVTTQAQSTHYENQLKRLDNDRIRYQTTLDLYHSHKAKRPIISNHIADISHI